MRINLSVVDGPHGGSTFSFEEHDNFIVGRAKFAHFQSCRVRCADHVRAEGFKTNGPHSGPYETWVSGGLHPNAARATCWNSLCLFISTFSILVLLGARPLLALLVGAGDALSPDQVFRVRAVRTCSLADRIARSRVWTGPESPWAASSAR
jgi:hypothetical protein